METFDPGVFQAVQAVSIIRKDSLAPKTQATYEPKISNGTGFASTWVSSTGKLALYRSADCGESSKFGQ